LTNHTKLINISHTFNMNNIGANATCTKDNKLTYYLRKYKFSDL